MPSLHDSHGRQDIVESSASEDAGIASWFQRAGRLARAVTAAHLTLDEAQDELVAHVTRASDLLTLRRAVWDAETLLGDDSLLLRLLRGAAQRATAPQTHLA